LVFTTKNVRKTSSLFERLNESITSHSPKLFQELRCGVCAALKDHVLNLNQINSTAGKERPEKYGYGNTCSFKRPSPHLRGSTTDFPEVSFLQTTAWYWRIFIFSCHYLHKVICDIQRC